MLITGFLLNRKLATNFWEKSNIFNNFFSLQLKPISNDSILPLIPTYYTNSRFNDISFTYDKLLKIIHSLDSNKAQGHYGISVRFLKLCCPSIIKPLLILFCNRLKFGTFTDDRKMSNFVPVHKWDNKQIGYNHHSVSL